VAGRCLLDDVSLKEAGFDMAFALLAETSDAAEAMTRPGPLLERIGAKIAERLGPAS
jgi:hypothetical protein